MPPATPTENIDSAPVISFPAIHRKKVTAAFDGGRLTSDRGVLLLAQAERTMGICRELAACIADPRDPSRVIHRVVKSCGRGSWPLPAATRMPMISTPCATIQAFVWRGASCPVQARAWQANQR